MKIEYLNPLSKAWERMKKALFQPFDIGKWFVLGFTAFLANLFREGGSGFNFSSPFDGGRRPRSPDILRFPETALDWVHAHPILFIAVIAGIFLLIALIVVFTWLSSRGTFMFLDNVVHDRALVVQPWRQFKALGNSLFLWRICFSLAVLIIMLPPAALFIFQAVQYSHGPAGPLLIIVLILVGFLWFVISVIITYISLFTTSFVVPIMHKHDMRILQAWRKFLPIFKSHFVYFIIYGLFRLILFIGIIIAVVITGCLTCCLGFIILALPYINAVALLPVYFTLRAFSLEFLAQWGPDYSVFPVPAQPSNDVPPPPETPPPGVTIIGM